MKEEIIKYGINVRECPHINAYNPNKPICQKSVGVGGNPSECDGNCDYVRNADIERLKKENLHYLACMTEQRNKLKIALEEIREYIQQFKKKKSRFYTLNDVITDIANNIEKIISEGLDERN